MKLLQLFSALALSLTAVACATPAPTSLAFSPQSNTALLVASGPPTTMTTVVEFRRVNMETLQFEGEVLSFANGAFGGDQVNHRSDIWLSLQEVQGGDYALVSLTTVTWSGEAWRCLDPAAPVFRLPAGQISIVQLNSYWAGAPTRLNARNDPAQAVLQEFESVRVNYPGVVGEGVVVAPSAAIHWEGGAGMWSNCREPPSFSILSDKRE